MQVSRSSTGFHKAGMPGSIPGPATSESGDYWKGFRRTCSSNLQSANCHRGWASAHRGLISLDHWVRLPNPPFFVSDGRVRKREKRRGREPARPGRRLMKEEEGVGRGSTKRWVRFPPRSLTT